MELLFRPRRLRRREALRRMVRETHLRPEDFIYPMFAAPGSRVRQEVASMPGVARLSADLLVDEAKAALDAGVPAVLLFGLPMCKDDTGSEAASPKGAVQQAVRLLKKKLPELVVITDVCLCGYTSHGHCGLLSGREVDNDATLEVLSQVAVSHAEAGADMVAPSDMMDGRVGATPGGPGRAGLRDGAHHVVRGQIRLQLLRPLPGRGGVRPGLRGPPVLPDGPGQHPGGPAGGGPGRGGGRRHPHGQAGSAVPGRHRPAGRGVRPAPGRLPGERRIRHDQGRRGQRLAG